MKRRKTTLKIGTISHGTLKTYHLVEAFADALDGLRLSRKDRAFINDVYRNIAKYSYENEGFPVQKEIEDNLETALERLFEILEYGEYCMPYTYFGTLEGDASDFGVWPDYGRIEDEVGQDEIVNVQLLDTAGGPSGGYSGYAVDVNDHGNMTLYRYTRGRRRIVWDVV